MTAIASLFLGMLLLPASTASACSARIPPPMHQVVRAADVVFIGQVTRVDDHYEHGIRRHGHTVAVERLYSGSVHERVLISTPTGDWCFGGPISTGRQLFVLERTEDGLTQLSFRGAQEPVDIKKLTGGEHVLLPGASPAVQQLERDVRRKSWTVRVGATVVGLLLGATLGLQFLQRRVRHDML
ncbi:hypothetical protein [Demetria terragena]|uniref:hypothetical protein n=1 Tax=Demetria terragena TaxID=63959 RepID=UPI0014615D4E|nr:hypothetical protein [Demetria terragena]